MSCSLCVLCSRGQAARLPATRGAAARCPACARALACPADVALRTQGTSDAASGDGPSVTASGGAASTSSDVGATVTASSAFYVSADVVLAGYDSFSLTPLHQFLLTRALTGALGLTAANQLAVTAVEDTDASDPDFISAAVDQANVFLPWVRLPEACSHA